MKKLAGAKQIDCDIMRPECAVAFAQLLTNQEHILTNIEILQEDQKEALQHISANAATIRGIEKSFDRLCDSLAHQDHHGRDINPREVEQSTEEPYIIKHSIKDIPPLAWLISGTISALTVIYGFKDRILALFN